MIFVVLLIIVYTVQSVLQSGGLLSFSYANEGDLYNTSYEVAPAMFGYQSYMGNITGVLILPANESYHKECNGGEPEGINPYIKFIDAWFVGSNDITDYILVIDRLDCYFTDKVSVAQSLGAKAAIICDHKVEALINMNIPSDYAKNISIPSVLLSRTHCQILMNNIGVQNWDPLDPSNMTYPTPYSMYNEWSIVTLEWGTPSLDETVEWQFWTSSLIWDRHANKEYSSAQFIRNFTSTVMALKNQTSFTPHFYIYNGTKDTEITTFGCQHTDLPCGRRCTNSGRYCYAILAESSSSIPFIDGMDVVQENLRSICVWEYTKKYFGTDSTVWWNYAILWDANCGILSASNYTSYFNQSCSFDQMDKLDPCGRLTIYVQDCIDSSGGYGYLDGINTLLHRELQFRDNSSISISTHIPSVIINEFQFRFFAYRQNDILDIICDALNDICLFTPSPTLCGDIDKDCNNVCFGNSTMDSCGQCLLISDPSWNSCLSPTKSPTNSPTFVPTLVPTLAPTALTTPPTNHPSGNPTSAPISTAEPTPWPTCTHLDKDCSGICFGNATIDYCDQCLLASDPSWNACLQPTNSPTSSPTPAPTLTPTVAPIAAPTNQPTDITSGPTTYVPTSAPTISPYMVDSCGKCLLPTDPAWNDCLVPTNSPTASPSFKPTTFPTNDPSNIPTSIPTSNVPTSPSPSDSIASNATRNHTANPTKVPSSTPSQYPTDTPSKSPTDLPSDSASIRPTSSPSFDPTRSPTYHSVTHQPITYIPTSDPKTDTPSKAKQVTNMPTQTPTRSRRLHFICHYYDNKQYITTHLSLLNYAILLRDSIVYSIQSISLQPIYYDEVQYNPLAAWGRGGIVDFVICDVFDINLLTDVECPSYSDSHSEYYISMGMFSIVTNSELNEFKEWLIDIMTNDEFIDKCNGYMNAKLNNVTSAYGSFEMIKVYVIDPLNDTISISTTEEDDLEYTGSNPDTITTVVIIIVCVLLIVIGIGVSIYLKLFKQKKDKIKQDEDKEGNYHNANNVEMNDEHEHNYEDEGIDDANTAIVRNIKDNNDINDNDLDNLHANININYHCYDADIVDLVNETHNAIEEN